MSDSKHWDRELVYAEAAKRIEYNQETGEFTWRDCPITSTRIRGTKAGAIRLDGYYYIQFQHKRLLGHRLAWVITFGRLPKEQIDHINMVRHDNRIANLREASNAENNWNRGIQARNTTGFKGVTMDKKTGTFVATLRANRREICLGRFQTAEEASMAYQTAAKEHHGEFARFH